MPWLRSILDQLFEMIFGDTGHELVRGRAENSGDMTCLPVLQVSAIILVLSGCQPLYLSPFQKSSVLFSVLLWNFLWNFHVVYITRWKLNIHLYFNSFLAYETAVAAVVHFTVPVQKAV